MGSTKSSVRVFQTPLGKTGMLICKDMDDGPVKTSTAISA